MGAICQIPMTSVYDIDTPNYANLNWQMLSQNGYYGCIGYNGGHTLMYSTAILDGQQAVESLNPKTYASKQAYVFQLANDAEIEQYFGYTPQTTYPNRHFIIASNYPFRYCQTMNYTRDGIISSVYDIGSIEYSGKQYFMNLISTMYVSGTPRYADSGAFSNMYAAYYSLAEFFRENQWIRPFESVSWNAHGEYLGANCVNAYGHKIGAFGEPNYYLYATPHFASGTSSTMKIIPSSGYSIAKPGHLKVFKDGVEIPYTQDLENGLINFMTP